jgi:putative oxidoreductase
MAKGTGDISLSIGLLILRVAVGSMIIMGHGWGKLIHFAEKASVFPDPLGLGSTISLSLAIFAEVFCSIAIILGFATRLAVIPLIIMMSVATFIFHADDPWQKKEFALLYLVPFLTLLFTGAGRYSLDTIRGRKNKYW